MLRWRGPETLPLDADPERAGVIGEEAHGVRGCWAALVVGGGDGSGGEVRVEAVCGLGGLGCRAPARVEMQAVCGVSGTVAGEEGQPGRQWR